MTYSYSDTIPPPDSAFERVPQDGLIEIYVWEAFTVKRTISYASFLVDHSFDRAPVKIADLPIGRTCFRFTEEEWIENVKPYLIQHWIPVTIRIVSAAVLAEAH